MAQGVSAAASLVQQAALIVGDISDNMGIALTTALLIANPDRRELVVDIEALVSALLTARTTGRVASAATWLQDWARDEGLAFTLRQQPDTANLVPVLSRSVVGQVLPRAVEIRDLTMSGEPEPLGLRHLMFALAERQAAQWPPLKDGGHPSSERLAALRALIVARTRRTPLKGEDVAAWQALWPKGRPLRHRHLRPNARPCCPTARPRLMNSAVSRWPMRWQRGWCDCSGTRRQVHSPRR